MSDDHREIDAESAAAAYEASWTDPGELSEQFPDYDFGFEPEESEESEEPEEPEADEGTDCAADCGCEDEPAEFSEQARLQSDLDDAAEALGVGVYYSLSALSSEALEFAELIDALARSAAGGVPLDRGEVDTVRSWAHSFVQVTGRLYRVRGLVATTHERLYQAEAPEPQPVPAPPPPAWVTRPLWEEPAAAEATAAPTESPAPGAEDEQPAAAAPPEIVAPTLPERLGIGPAQINAILTEATVVKAELRTRSVPETIAEAILLVKAGCTSADAGKHVGVSSSTVSRWVLTARQKFPELFGEAAGEPEQGETEVDTDEATETVEVPVDPEADASATAEDYASSWADPLA